MKNVKIIKLEEVDSTNSYLRTYTPDKGENITVVTTEYQSSGRGQGKNTWESKPGENLLMSIMIHPHSVPANKQFILSQAIALAVRDALRIYIGDIKLKWPNDIYWHDHKLGGILIECSLKGKNIKDCILGLGINVNQEVFDNLSKNPISIYQITGRHIDREDLMHSIIDDLQHYLCMIEEKNCDPITTDYLHSLYRGHGYHQYSDANGKFLARLVTVQPDGKLVLKDENGMLRTYAFKEVKYEIEGKTFNRNS